jgi:carboxymethylenebutenolidase
VCYDGSARPPLPPAEAGEATGRDIELTASDGNRFAAYLATPEHPSGARIVLLPDANGLNAFYRELAVLFARTGSDTLAIDYYGRTAGAGERDQTFDIEPHLGELRREGLMSDVRAAVEYFGTGRTFVVGFCMGGGTALQAGTTDLRLAGVVGFYAWTGELGRDPELPEHFVTGIRCPVLGLFGGADSVIPVSVPRAFDEYLDRAAVAHQIVIYPGEPHGFFERHHRGEAGHEAAVSDAWRKLLDFVAIG